MLIMDNPEEILLMLERFTKLKPKDIPRELEEYLCFVAKTGDTVYRWPIIKHLFREKLINVIKDFHDTTPSVEDLPEYPNVDPFNYETMKNALLERLETFNAAPFTIQRISELLTDPRKQYTRIDKFMRAVEKNILVVSTIEPGRRQTDSENGDSLDLVVNGDISTEVDVDIDMENEALPSIDTLTSTAASVAASVATVAIVPAAATVATSIVATNVPAAEITNTSVETAVSISLSDALETPIVTDATVAGNIIKFDDQIREEEKILDDVRTEQNTSQIEGSASEEISLEVTKSLIGDEKESDKLETLVDDVALTVNSDNTSHLVDTAHQVTLTVTDDLDNIDKDNVNVESSNVAISSSSDDSSSNSTDENDHSEISAATSSDSSEVLLTEDKFITSTSPLNIIAEHEEMTPSTNENTNPEMSDSNITTSDHLAKNITESDDICVSQSEDITASFVAEASKENDEIASSSSLSFDPSVNVLIESSTDQPAIDSMATSAVVSEDCISKSLETVSESDLTELSKKSPQPTEESQISTSTDQENSKEIVVPFSSDITSTQDLKAQEVTINKKTEEMLIEPSAAIEAVSQMIADELTSSILPTEDLKISNEDLITTMPAVLQSIPDTSLASSSMIGGGGSGDPVGTSGVSEVVMQSAEISEMEMTTLPTEISMATEEDASINLLPGQQLMDQQKSDDIAMEVDESSMEPMDQ